MPTLILGAEARRVGDGRLDATAYAVATSVDFAALIENILRVRPDTEQVLVVIGSSAIEQYWRAEMERETESFQDRLGFAWSSDSTVDEMLLMAAELPARWAIFYYFMSVDAGGVAYSNDAVLDEIRRVAAAPIFGFGDYQPGRGIVGGPLYPTRTVGIRGAALAREIIDGGPPSDSRPPAIALDVPAYDWRELRRWRIDESLLPQGAVVRFREPGVWQRYTWQIVAAVSALVVQLLLILAMLIERRRRRMAEAEGREQLLQLKRRNRHAAAGELSASLEHELRQPLAAMVFNVDGALLWLEQQSPEQAKIRDALTAAVSDGHRANAVIESVRSLFSRETGKRSREQLSVIVEEILKLMQSALNRHSICVHSALGNGLPPASVDRVQLQQVILNLLLNAIEAMSGQDGPERVLRVTTEAGDDGAISLTIADSGSGVEPEALERIFEPFVTTKSGDNGLGLAICRSIIDAHGGRLRASPVEPRGLAVRVTLPAASGTLDRR